MRRTKPFNEIIFLHEENAKLKAQVDYWSKRAEREMRRADNLATLFRGEIEDVLDKIEKVVVASPEAPGHPDGLTPEQTRKDTAMRTSIVGVGR